MIQIELKRNDICLCGSNKKYKKCCLLKNNHFSYVTDLDFIIVEEFINSIPKEQCSTAFWDLEQSINDLKSLCEKYKKRYLGTLNYEKNKDIAYKYIFKEHIDSAGEYCLFICNMIELNKENSMFVRDLEENLKGAAYMITKLKDTLLPNELLHPEMNVKTEDNIETYFV